MFQKTTHDADHLNVFRLTGHLRNQAAASSDDQFDPYTRLRGLDQLVNNYLVRQGIHLDPNIAFLTILYTSNPCSL